MGWEKYGPTFQQQGYTFPPHMSAFDWQITNITAVGSRACAPHLFDWGGGGGNGMFVHPHFKPHIFIFHLNYVYIILTNNY